MTNFIIIFLCFFLGKCFSYIKRFPTSTSQSLNLFIIYLSLPAMILTKFSTLLISLKLDGPWWIPVSMSWLTFFLSFILITFLGKRLSWSRAKIGALVLTTGLGNTSFVGFPLLEAILGKEAISVGILADQPGSFFILSTLGILVASQFSGLEMNLKKMLNKLFSFPPFLALLLSLLWYKMGLIGYELVNPALDKISQTLVPIALFAVGFQLNLKWSVIRKRKIPLMIGLGLKLFIFPILFFVLYKKMINGDSFYTQVTILEAAMATQITSAVVASEFNLDTELANLMVGISIPISLLTVPLMNRVLFS